MADDELWAVKNAFYLGCHQQAISEALGANVSEDSRTMCSFYMHRAYVEQGQYHLVTAEVGASAPVPLLAVKLLAEYMGGGRPAKDAALAQLKDMLAAPSAPSEPQLLLVGGVMLTHEGDYKEALKYTHQATELETMGLVAHIYLAMNRPDLARKQVGLMSASDDDATLTKLATAWVSLAEGGEKAQEAVYEFQELGEKYNTSLMLTNGMALANLHMGKYEEAERLLQEALSQSASHVDTLANMVVCMQHLRKPAEQVARYINQLRAVAPSHPWLLKYSDLEASFDRCAAQLEQTGAA